MDAAGNDDFCQDSGATPDERPVVEVYIESRAEVGRAAFRLQAGELDSYG